MSQCISFTVTRDWCFRRAFLAAGLRPSVTTLADGATVHCWGPAHRDPARPALVLIHGFGASAIWQWYSYLRPFLRSGFDVYVPDLLFFGVSCAPGPDRSEAYQAQCVMATMEAAGVRRFGVVGVSYGGFVSYRMAAMFPAAVERVVLVCAGVCLEERDIAEGLFVVSNADEAVEILLPQRPEKLRQLIRLSFVKPPPLLPSCFLQDYIKVMCTNFVKEKSELIHTLIDARKKPDLPKISQPTLIIWGEQDKIFPLELGHRLNRHLGDRSQLVVIKNAGHAVNLEKPKLVSQNILAFFHGSPLQRYNGWQHYGTRWKIICNLAGLYMRRLASKLRVPPKKPWIASYQSIV